MILVYFVNGNDLDYIGATDSDINAKTMIEAHFKDLTDPSDKCKYATFPLVSANWYDVSNNVSIAPSDVQDIIASNQ